MQNKKKERNYHIYRSQGRCGFCGTPIEGKKRALCEACQEQNKNRSKNLYETCKEQGICVRCRKKEASPGFVACEECRVKDNEKNKRWRLLATKKS